LTAAFYKPFYKRWWVKLVACIIVFPLSFVITDYYLRGYLYYTKRTINIIYQNTWQNLFPPSGPITYTLRVVVDQQYRQKYPDWKTHVPALIDRVNKRFSDEFDINFIPLDISPYDIPDNMTDFDDILTYGVKNIDRRRADILVILSGKEFDIEQGAHWVNIGVAHYLGNSILVSDDSQLLHEMGHLFGAIDYPPGDPNFDVESIYSYKYTKKTRIIDSMNYDRIMQHKYRFIW